MLSALHTMFCWDSINTSSLHLWESGHAHSSTGKHAWHSHGYSFAGNTCLDAMRSVTVPMFVKNFLNNFSECLILNDSLALSSMQICVVTGT